jgi:arylsulfatase A-like enzyme
MNWALKYEHFRLKLFELESLHQNHIDRIAREGMLFTSYYMQQSCTAGRAAFITGQSPLRTGS